MSNGHSANWRVRLISSDWLKVDFWIHGPMAADTSYSEKLVKGCCPFAFHTHKIYTYQQIYIEDI